jgi:xanthosine utilization system XapX-like protein
MTLNVKIVGVLCTVIVGDKIVPSTRAIFGSHPMPIWALFRECIIRNGPIALKIDRRLVMYAARIPGRRTRFTHVGIWSPA